VGCYVVSNKVCQVQNRNCDPRFGLVADRKPHDHTDRPASFSCSRYTVVYLGYLEVKIKFRDSVHLFLRHIPSFSYTMSKNKFLSLVTNLRHFVMILVIDQINAHILVL